MKEKLMSATLIAILAIAGAHAQTSLQKGIGVIIYADGDEISVSRSSSLKSYAVGTGGAIGVQLEAGDLVQTGPGTTAEIQLLPSQTVIKLGENTSFRLTGLNTSGGTTIDLIYGRLRAKVDTALGGNGFSVRGKTAVAAVRGTDFGYDVVSVPGIGQEPGSQIYCFDGKMDVLPLQPEDWAAGQANKVFDTSAIASRKSFPLVAGQMVTVYDTPDDKSRAAIGKAAGKDTLSTEGTRSVVTSASIKPAIRQYWTATPNLGRPYTEDELQSKFYGLKKASSDQASTPAASSSPAPQKDQNAPPASVADSIQPLGMTKPIPNLSPNQYVLVDSPLKLGGIIMGSVGMVGNLAGLALYNFGNDLGLSKTDGQMAGLVTVSATGVVLFSGILCYIIGLFQ
jgi:hypothetical protein